MVRRVEGSSSLSLEELVILRRLPGALLPDLRRVTRVLPRVVLEAFSTSSGGGIVSRLICNESRWVFISSSFSEDPS